MIDEPYVKVTLGDIYRMQVELSTKFGPVPEKVTDHEVRIKALDARLDALEKWRWVSTGMATALGTGAGALLFKALGA